MHVVTTSLPVPDDRLEERGPLRAYEVFPVQQDIIYLGCARDYATRKRSFSLVDVRV